MAKRHPSCTVPVGIPSCLPDNAFTRQERITLMLTGSACAGSHASVEQALNRTTGVRHLDLEAIPGHILVDVETGTVFSDAFEKQVNDITS
jgi:hypothetical protein